MAPEIDKRRAEKLIASRDFSEQSVRSIDCSKRDLSGLNARLATLRDAKFIETNLADADFQEANLTNSHFRASPNYPMRISKALMSKEPIFQVPTCGAPTLRMLQRSARPSSIRLTKNSPRSLTGQPLYQPNNDLSCRPINLPTSKNPLIKSIE